MIFGFQKRVSLPARELHQCSGVCRMKWFKALRFNDSKTVGTRNFTAGPETGLILDRPIGPHRGVNDFKMPSIHKKVLMQSKHCFVMTGMRLSRQGGYGR